MESASKDCPFPFMWTPETPSGLTDMYDKWSTTYDKDNENIECIGPMAVVKSLAAFYQQERQNIKILDVGAGTGRLGVELQKLGFYTIDGLDPSKGMLDMARATLAYTELHCQYFTSEPTHGLDKDSYDVIISSGSMLRGHLPPDCFIEAARLVKPGGIICMTTRTDGTGGFDEVGYRDQFIVVTSQLQEKKKLEKLKWEKVHYYNSAEGVIMAYRVLA